MGGFEGITQPILRQGIPDKIGQYIVLERLGQGGMGTVYRVRDTAGRDYALKILRKDRSARDIARFKSEIKILGQLELDNIPKIYNIGQHRGRPYFVMELLRGTSLVDVLKEKNVLREREAAQIIWKVATAIAKAHRAGVVHRDINPANIMLVNKQPYIMDFGIARSMNTDMKITHSGDFLGTVNYMPPEQANGETDNIGTWSDVYALGATLYHLLTGTPPYEAESDLQVIVKIITEELPGIRDYNPRVSHSLESIVEKAMAKRIPERYNNARELALELNKFLRKRPLSVKVRKVRKDTTRPLWLISMLMTCAAIISLTAAIVSILSTPKQVSQNQPTAHKKSITQVKEIHTIAPMMQSSRIMALLPPPPHKFTPLSQPMPHIAPRTKPPGADETGWHAPRLFFSQGHAKWREQGNLIVGSCTRDFGLLGIKDHPQWRNYALYFEVKVRQGEFGAWLRGFASDAQFRDFLPRLCRTGIADRWFRVTLKAQGKNLELEVQGISSKLKSLQSIPTKRPGLMGIAVGTRDGRPALVYIRNLRIRKLIK